MMKEKVSIIVPVYNAEKTIERCINSLLNQTYKDLQIILINDGSEDDSLLICQRFQEKDNRIQIISHKNQGVSYTRNQGIKQAEGNYLMFVDSDDYVEKDMIQRYLETMINNEIDVVIGGIHFKSKLQGNYDKIPKVNGKLNSYDFWSELCVEDNSIWGYVPNKMYRTKIIKDNNILFNESMSAQEDFAFALTYFSMSDRFYVFDYCGYFYEYALEHRRVPIEFLVDNQQKILVYAKKAGVESYKYNNIIEKIQTQVYTGLYHCKTKEEIISIMQLPNLIDDIIKINLLKREKKIILHWFMKQKVNSIWLYFYVRRWLSKILQRI